jgi:hypothetical protein
MDDKDQFDAFMKLADFRMKVRMERRQLQWRVSLGLWIALAAGMIAFKNAQIHVSLWLLAPFLAVVVLGHAVLWVFGNWWRNERDAVQAYRMIAQAEALLDVEYHPTPRFWEKQVKRMEGMLRLEPGKLRILHSQPPFFEMLATVLLAAAWCIINALGKV